MEMFNKTLSMIAHDNHCSINLSYGSHNTLRVVVQKDKYIETKFINNQDEYKSDGDVIMTIQRSLKIIDDQIEKIRLDSLNELVRDWCIEHDCKVSLKWNKPGELEITAEED